MPLLGRPTPPSLPGPRAAIPITGGTTPGRGRGRIIIIAIFALLGFLLLYNYEPTPPSTAVPTPYQPNTITNPAYDDAVLLQADRVAAEGDRYALEVERDRVAAELSELSQKIAQADQQQQLALIRQQQQLEIDRQAIDNRIRQWDAERAKVIADAQAAAEASALATEADRQQAEAIQRLARAREAQATAEAWATLANIIAYTMAGSAALLFITLTLALAYFIAGFIYSNTHYTRPTPTPSPPKQLPPPTPTAVPDPALISLQELMQEIERNRPSPPIGVPTAAPVRERPSRVRTDVPDSPGLVQDTQQDKIRPTRNLTDEEKRRVLAAYHEQNGALRSAGRQVFTYANGRTDDIIRDIVKEFEEA